MAEKTPPRIYHVCLGRFSPLQLGHQRAISTLIEKFGQDNVLVLIGSSTSINSRTPYSYERRKAMISTIFPKLRILPLPDTNPSLVHFDGSTNDLWLDNLSALESNFNAHFIFYGGSTEDLAVLAERFETAVLVDRFGIGEGISATQVRLALDKGDTEALGSLLDPRVLPLAVSGYREYLASH